jgi:hypothetical protein
MTDPNISASGESVSGEQKTIRGGPRTINGKNHTPGRELDALIAEKVMGAEWIEDAGRQTGRRYRRLYKDHWIIAEQYEGEDTVHAPSPVLPHYSSEIGDSWKVREKMRELGFHLGLVDDGHATEPWEAYFDQGRNKPSYNAWASTAPLAICLAALSALDA